jgi:integrase
LVFALALLTAQRRSDVIRMGPAMVKHGIVTLRQKKTRTEVHVPIVPELAQIIAASVCGISTYIVSDRGKPYTGGSLANAFRRWCNAAGLPKEAVIHGLRKAWCRRAAERGMTEDEMMSITGHATSKQLRHYLAMVDREAVALRAMQKMMG